MINDLLGLDNPHIPFPSLAVEGCDGSRPLNFLNHMLLIRKVEQKLAFERKSGSIGGPVHLGVGQEAAAVGVSERLKPQFCKIGSPSR